MTTRVIAGLLLLAAGAGCPSRDLPPPPAQDEPKKEEAPFCGKVFREAKIRGGAQCCVQPSAGLLKSVDIVAEGLLAPAGVVIVDDIHSPSLIFGVADGQGRFKQPLDPADEDRVTFVRSLMRTSAAPVS